MTRYQGDPSEYIRLDDPRTATQGPRPVASWARYPAAKPANRDPMTRAILCQWRSCRLKTHRSK